VKTFAGVWFFLGVVYSEWCNSGSKERAQGEGLSVVKLRWR